MLSSIRGAIMKFSLKLKELREKKGVSQRDVAEALKISKGSIGMWESTDRIPNAKQLNLLADFFGVSVDELLGRDEITPEERAQGARETIKKSITPIEDEMLYAFREVEKKLGVKGQRAVIDVAESMAGMK